MKLDDLQATRRIDTEAAPEEFASDEVSVPANPKNASLTISAASAGKTAKRVRVPCSYQRTCRICGSGFESPSKGGLFCSEPCKIEAARRREEARLAIVAREAEKIEKRKALLAAEALDTDWCALKSKWKIALAPYMDEKKRLELYNKRVPQ